MSIWDEEEEKAILYRQQWDARIAYRQNQLWRLRGQAPAFEELWAVWRVPYDPTNYIDDTPGNDGGFITPFDFDDNGAISSSPVRLAGARHAGDQNDRPHGGD